MPTLPIHTLKGYTDYGQAVKTECPEIQERIAQSYISKRNCL